MDKRLHAERVNGDQVLLHVGDDSFVRHADGMWVVQGSTGWAGYSVNAAKRYTQPQLDHLLAEVLDRRGGIL